MDASLRWHDGLGAFGGHDSAGPRIKSGVTGREGSAGLPPTQLGLGP